MSADAPPAVAVIYCSKSTEDRHGSIPTQLDDCRALAEHKGWAVMGEFSDEGFSAYHGNRGPGLARARAAAAEHAPCVIVVQDVDRLARGAGDEPGAADHLGELFFALRRQRIRLWSVRTGEVDSLRAVMEGERSHGESERKAQAVKSGMRRRAAERGKLAGGPRPYGYQWVGPKYEKTLVVVLAEAEIVREIYRSAINGMSQLAIARALNARGVPSTLGGKWVQGNVRKVLTNPLYVGRIRQSGEEFPGVHEAIVDEATWAAAARIRAAAVGTKGHGGGRRPVGPHLLTRGLLRCGECGAPLLPRSVRREGERPYDRYICDGRRSLGVDHCSQGPLDQATMDAALLGELTRTYLDLDAMRRQIEGRIASDRVRADESRADAEREAATADARYRRVMRAFQDGLIEAEDWADQRPTLLGERTAAEARLHRAEEHVATLDVAAPTLDAEAELFRHLSDLRAAVVDGIGKAPNVHATRTLLRRLFRRVVYLAPGHSWLTTPGFVDTQAALVGTGYLILDLADSAVEWMDANGTPVGRLDHHALDLSEQPVAVGLSTSSSPSAAGSASPGARNVVSTTGSPAAATAAR